MTMSAEAIRPARTFTRVGGEGKDRYVEVRVLDGSNELSNNRFPLRQVVFRGRKIVDNVFGLAISRAQRKGRTLAEDINTNG